MNTGMVFDIRRFSIRDGPGIRTTVFFKGCPLACWWCHNPESQALQPELMLKQYRCIRCGTCLETCEQEAISWDDDILTTADGLCTLCGDCVETCVAEARQVVGREMTVRQLMAEIERDVIFYDESGGGVTISGGEPLMQHGFLLALLQASKEMEIHTVLDTCGFATWEVLDSIRHYVDLFLYDLKLMDDTRHLQFTGVSNHLIIKNLETLSQLGHEILVRVPIIPGITDDDKNIRQIGTFIATLQEVKQIDTLPYHAAALGKYDRLNKAYKFPDISPPEKERIFEITETLEGYGLQVNVGG